MPDLFLLIRFRKVPFKLKSIFFSKVLSSLFMYNASKKQTAAGDSSRIPSTVLRQGHFKSKYQKRKIIVAKFCSVFCLVLLFVLIIF